MAQEKQKFLDEVLFPSDKISSFEKGYGSGFIGPGGLDSAKKFCEYLDVEPNDFVLDVGCGVGGNDFYISKRFGARVLGTDLSANMIDAANTGLQKQEQEIRDKVSFQVVDADNMNFNKETFDAVFSKYAFLYVRDKAKLLSQFMEWLKPGGTLLIINHNQGKEIINQEFQDFTSRRRWHMYTLEKQKKLIETSGFINVEAKDISEHYLEYMEDAIKAIAQNRNQMLKEQTLSEYEQFFTMEKKKILWCTEGTLCWSLFKATKPES